jgi:nucleoside-diphosphate-sugar epimerase
MDVLIIGGSRFVGPLLVEKLLAAGHSLTIFNRGNIRTSYGKAEFVRGDRESGFSLKKSFDVVIDMCAYEARHTQMAIEQLDFDFLIHMSTAAAYKKSEAFPLTEDSPLGPWPLWGAYNAGKVACEAVLSESGIKYASIRPVYILGPNNYVERESFIYSRLKKGRALELPGNGNAVSQFVFSRDVAALMAMIAGKKAAGAFNCAGDTIVTLKGLVEMMGRVCGRKPAMASAPEKDGVGFDERSFPFANENFIVSNEKAKALGASFTPLETGLAEDYGAFYSKL